MDPSSPFSLEVLPLELRSGELFINCRSVRLMVTIDHSSSIVRALEGGGGEN